MIFRPKFSISLDLLEKLKSIALLTKELEVQRPSKVALVNFEAKARELSAYASTSIEGNPLPLTEVKKILKNQPKSLRDSEREVLNYNQALLFLHGMKIDKPLALNEKLVLNLHNLIMRNLLPKFHCGKWRKTPVFVNDPKLLKPIFFPPDHKDVPKLMESLFRFVEEQENTLDPILLAGIFHKQMILIHAFMDGNGRTTRLATKVLLAKLGMNTFPLFSFENFYNQNVTQYFKQVGERGNYYDVSQNVDFSSWLNYFADGILDELYRVKKELQFETITPTNILEPHHEKVLEHIRKYGYITDKDYSKITERAKATRSLDFKKLLKLKLIVRLGVGRSTIYKLS